MSNNHVKAAAFYIDVCLEHGQVFPLRNIIQVVPGFISAVENKFLYDVENLLIRYRLDEEIDGMDPALRTLFLRLR